MKKHPLQRFGEIVGGVRSKWAVLGAWLAIAIVLGLVFPQVNSVENYKGDDLPDYTMSIQANEIIDEQFSSDAGLPLLIVWYKESGILQEDLEAIQQLYKELAANPLEQQQLIPPFDQLPVQALMGSLSENGKSIITPVFFEVSTNAETLEENFNTIREKTEAITGANPFDTEGLEAEGLQARFSGPAGISVDATGLFASADFKLMVATVIIILVILLVIYRSPIMAMIPLIVVGIAFLVVSPVLGWMAESGWIQKDAQSIAIMIVLLFGAGTDYCLFMITKYRDKLLEVQDKNLAIVAAVKDSMGAIVMSGLTVVIGLGTLILADYGAFQRFAIPFSLGILFTGIAVVTLLPAILAMLGRKAFWPVVPLTEEQDKELALSKGRQPKPRKEPHAFMRKVGKFATGRPWVVIVTTGIILISLAFASTNIKYNFDLISSFPENVDSREGFTLIEENFSAGELAPVKLIVDTEGKEVDLSEQLAKLPYIAVVKDIQYGEFNTNYQLYEVDLDKDPYSTEAMADVEQMLVDMETIVVDAGLDKESFLIGGETMKQIDSRDVQKRDESLVQPVIILIILAVLLVYLRAIITSIQLMATVLVSFFAALGAGWLVIHGILGHEAIAGSIPLYSFVFIIALGNDYNIFMISDIWKNRQKGIGLKDSIVNGVASTGSVITSAGIILAGTFAVLASLPIQLLVQFGIVTAIGVLLDTFIVRPLLVPALLTVFGKWSYWPGKLFKK